jgi:hypothetical protein
MIQKNIIITTTKIEEIKHDMEHFHKIEHLLREEKREKKKKKEYIPPPPKEPPPLTWNENIIPRHIEFGGRDDNVGAMDLSSGPAKPVSMDAEEDYATKSNKHNFYSESGYAEIKGENVNYEPNKDVGQRKTDSSALKCL